MKEQYLKVRKRIRILTMCLICVIGIVWCSGIKVFALTTNAEYEYEVLEDGTVEITGYSGEDTDIIIPSEIGEVSVTSIGYEAFYECTSLTNITIPDSVTSIRVRAFGGCDGLISITIPDSVTSIGGYAFYGCTSLTSITIPDSVTSIGDWAFYGCTSLTSITIPKNVASIEENVFTWCTSLTNIVVDSQNPKYESRNSNAIIEKSSNTLIVGCAGTTIPDSVTSIGKEAFDRRLSLTSITIPDSVTSIGNWAFYCCINLTSVTIANGEMSIAWNAFEGCRETLTIYTVKGSSVEQWAKDNNIKVEALDGDTPEKPDTPQNPNTPNTSDKGQTEGEGTQTTLPKVGTKYTVSNGVYKVTKSTATSKEVTFAKPKNSKKTSLTIPATIKIDGQTYKVTEIASKTFKNSKTLKSVTIGKNVKKIGKEAFSGCKKLNKITIKSTVLKSVGKNAIKGIKKDANIKVPKKQYSKYKTLFKSKTGYKKTMKIKK